MHVLPCSYPEFTVKKALFMLVAGSVLAGSVFAQAAAPAANTATNAVTKAAAALPAAASAVKSVAADVKAVVAPTAASTPATPVAASAPAAPAKAAVAAGAGVGKVWVNGKVYHCAGTKYYGKTKAGAYMTEAEAKAKGAQVVKGQVCK
jgi:hypothetical protein